MKLTKQLENELQQSYEAFWESLLSVNMRKFNSFLDDDFKQIGTSQAEFFFNKKEAAKFLKATEEQVVGNIELRNRIIKIEPVDKLILITEQSDAYVKIDDIWTFYAKTRATSLLQKKGKDWKFIQQHISFPDNRTEEGETIALEKISKENLELRDAVKRRTIELEVKSRELEIEAALERVRSRAMAMHKTDELLEAAELVSKELSALGVTSMNVSYAFVDEEEKNASYYSLNPVDGKIAPFPFVFPHTETKVMRSILSSWKKQESFNMIELDEKATLKHQTWVGEHIQNLITKNNSGIPFSVEEFLAISPKKAVIYTFNFKQGYLFNIGGERLTNEQEEMVLRFTKVFDMTYRRFLDLKLAESQAREAQIELGLERVRARTMAMQKSDELRKAVLVIYEQLQQLNFDSKACNIIIIDNETSIAQYWVSGFSQELYPESYTVPYLNHPYQDALMKPWKQGDKYVVYEYTGKMKQSFDEIFFTQTEFKNVPDEAKNVMIGLKSVMLSTAFINYGALQSLGAEPLSEENANILQRFAKVFEQTYTRFLDLQKAEAQAREAQIEAALERVRSRSMAMRKPDELTEIIGTIFTELSRLDVALLRCVIEIWNSETYDQRWWMANAEDAKRPVSFFIKYIDLPPNKAFLNAWKKKLNKWVYLMKGDIKREWDRQMLSETELSFLPVTVKTGMRNPAPTYCNTSFNNYGCLTFVSPEPLPDDQFDILIRFANVFDQTYTRFNDLQKAEAQAREAQIEAALERVRSRSMGMQKSEELRDVIQVIYEQFLQLGINVQTTGFYMDIQESNDWNLWAADAGHSYPTRRHIPYLDHPVFHRYVEAKEKGLDVYAYSVTYHSEEKNKILKHWIENNEQMSDELIEWCYSQPGWNVSSVIMKNVGLYLYNFELTPFSDSDNAILLRFSKVFEQTYTRFLDLQKAEEQAREAQIELGLERVRARAMAMQKSDELKELIGTVYHELTKLDLALDRCLIWVMNSEDLSSRLWMANPESQPVNFYIPHHDNPPYLAFVKAWKDRNTKWQYDLHGKVKKEWDGYVFNQTEMKHLPEPVKKNMQATDKVIFAASFHNFGCLQTAGPEPLKEEQFDILNRFAKVFDLTYTRFNDLKKAEAQARESQIEASLERVRSKTMAMHNSQDVGDTVATMFDELVKLGVETIRCGVGIMYEPNQMEVWTAKKTENEKAELIIGRLNMTIHPLLQGIFNGWKNKNITFSYEMKDQDLVDYYTALISSPDYHIHYDIASLPQQQFHNDFYFPEGALFSFSTEQLSAEASQIFKRFAGVFGQTYRRYLDLLKAEAQAREATIEASLERVRARTMAMHNSEDVSTATATMFTELEKLGIENFRGGIANIRVDKTQEVWSVNNLAEGKIVKAVGSFNIDDHPFWQLMYKEWKNKKEFLYYFLAGKDKEDYVKILSTTQNYLPQKIQQFPDVHFQVYFFGEGGVWTNSLQPHSEEDKQVMKKFASVFSLTFRRYQDLKKAEEQAREATIEAALEKVRGKAMAMHNSNDLTVTASEVFTELRKLGIKPMRCGVGLLTKESRKVILYAATSSEEGDNLSLAGWVILEGQPVLTEIYDSWYRGEDYFPVMKGELLKTYYEKIKSGFVVPDAQSGYEQYGYFLAFSEGTFYSWSEKPFTETEIRILNRFKNILDLTFRRYIELQKSEANALEAIKQAALDRVRAEIASMRTISDLDRITPLIWNELTILGVPFIRCGVFIMDETKQLIHTFLSTPDGKAIAAFHLPYDTPGNIGKVINPWRSKEIYIDHWGEPEFISMAETLVKQGAIEKEEQYLNTIPVNGFYLHFLPFLQGMLYVANTIQLGKEDLKLIQSVADAFSTAYARYEDFNKLEAAKQQVDKTLVDLNQTQAQLIQAEKMASLGELTAGIAHEIQNPLNFVNNFSEVSKELLDEMKQAIEKGDAEEAKEIMNDVIQNLEKINHHGKRAEAIVKGMLQHSRSSSGKKEPTNINALADEYLRLAYHGLRAKEKSFNATMKIDFDETIGNINIIPQDIGRVILNLINNAFYVVNEKSKQNIAGYEPTVSVSTRKEGNKVLVSVKDNGNGIPQKILDKIFQPFFTTKPTGQGTGLGLSLSYDIVKSHWGELEVETKEGEGSEFLIKLPIA